MVRVRGWTRSAYRLLLTFLFMSTLLLLISQPSILHQQGSASVSNQPPVSANNHLSVSIHNHVPTSISDPPLSPIHNQHTLVSGKHRQSTESDKNNSAKVNHNPSASFHIPNEVVSITNASNQHLRFSRLPLTVKKTMEPRLRPFVAVLTNEEKDILMDLASKVLPNSSFLFLYLCVFTMLRFSQPLSVQPMFL